MSQLKKNVITPHVSTTPTYSVSRPEQAQTQKTTQEEETQQQQQVPLTEGSIGIIPGEPNYPTS